MKASSHDSRDSNPGPSRDEAGVPTTQLHCSVTAVNMLFYLLTPSIILSDLLVWGHCQLSVRD